MGNPPGGYGPNLGGGGGGGGSFSTITGGTNTNSLIIGSGGSLATSGTGTIVASSVLPIGQFGGGTVIDSTQSPYNVLTGFSIADATFVATQNTISCPNNDCNFTASMNGWICFGTNQTNDLSGLSSVVVLPQGMLTVTGAQTATCSGGNATQSITGAGMLIVGPDMSTNLASAWTATIAQCGILMLPAGPVLVQSGQFNSTNNRCSNQAPGYPAYQVKGWSPAISQIIPTPNFSSASCTGGFSSNACFGGANGLKGESFSIYGGGVSGIGAGFNGKVGWDINGSAAFNDSYLISVYFMGWGASTTGFTGISIDHVSSANLINVINDGFGSTGLNIPAPSILTTVQLTNCFIAVNNVASMIFNGPNLLVKTAGGIYGSLGTNVGFGAVQVLTGAEWWSTNDTLPYTSGSSGEQVYVGGSSICHLTGCYLNNVSTNTPKAALVTQNTALVWAEDTVFASAGNASNDAVLLQTGTTFYSKGGNRFVAGASGNAINRNSGANIMTSPTDVYTSGIITTFAPTCSESAGNGTCAAVAGSTNEKGVIRITAGTTTLLNPSFLMTFAGAFSGPSAAAPTCTFTVQNTGTGSWVTAAPVGGGLPAPTAISTASVTVGITTAVNTVSASTYDVAYNCVAK